MEDIREFIKKLEETGNLARVRAEVDPSLEVTEINRQVMERGSKALLFENVKGSKIPILINAFGSWDMTKMAMENDPEQIGKDIISLLKTKPPKNLGEALDSIKKLRDLFSFPPKIVGSGKCKEVKIMEPNLNQIPILKCWPGDAGKFITFPLVITKDPETGERNVGTYRMQVLSENTTAMHWQTQKHGMLHLKKASERNTLLEVAVAIGSDPATMFSAIAPMPEGFDEFLLAGFIRKKGVELVKCETSDLYVPANAEIVLEGYIDPRERVTEGPFGDHTGFYSQPTEFPVFHVMCITMRRDPIYVTTAVGKPIWEDAFIGKAIERLFFPLIKMQVPEIVDMNFPPEGIFNNLVVVSIKKRYPGQARKVMASLWGLGQISLTKGIIVVDDWVNVHDMKEVIWTTFASMDPARDVMILDKMPTDTLDHASPLQDVGSKIGIDATSKWKEEGYNREWPSRIVPDEATKKMVEKRWKEYGL